MKKIILAFALVSVTVSLFAQKKTTTSATINVDATTIKDKLPKAENKTAIAALDLKSGAVQVEAVVKNFVFSNPMMQGHFNGPDWFNSDKFPKMSFKGKIDDLTKINFTKDGVYSVNVVGNFTIKDVTKPLTIPTTITVKAGAIEVKSDFNFALADFNISSVHIESGKVERNPKVSFTAQLN